ncbi:MAG TPA: hypothetical protein VKP66_18840 [Steroidobacteraceae bacterium]|nr:hypothetical protein [Steroidobacteraceae bacterium]
MSGADLAGVVGLGLLIVLCIAALPWPRYPQSSGWVDEATRRENADRLSRDIDAARVKRG